ncbi:undecaprenyl-diphosphate phosphatase [bacterium]|nr:undecaprenyl-diphosphate phosphatase [bacterium]MBU1600159.1 undecaprenyl-diphosphate phosphatase [bacterium]
MNDVILGIIQGLTEFLPISSSGHLVLTKKLLGIEPDIAFDVFLHFGTLIALFCFYIKRITAIFSGFIKSFGKRELIKQDINARFAYLILVGTVPTFIIALFFKDTFESLFSEPRIVVSFLFITGLLLFATKIWSRETKGILEMGFLDAIIIGTFQGIAIAPGISRSGSCLSSGLFLGLKRETAFDFAFLLSFPAIIGAFLSKTKDMLEVGGGIPLGYLMGAGVAFVFGLLSLFLLAKIVKGGKVHYFAYYCWAVGLLGLCLI